MSRIAIVIGHSRTSQGAVAVDGIQEWAWHSVLAVQVERAIRARGAECRVFERPTGGYRSAMARLVGEINAWRPTVVVSLHFNAFPEPPGVQSVRGTMALHWPGSIQGERIARELSEAVAAAQGTRDRGPREQARSWAGSPLYLLQDTHAPAVILETHYGDDANDHDLATRARDSGATALAIASRLARC